MKLNTQGFFVGFYWGKGGVQCLGSLGPREIPRIKENHMGIEMEIGVILRQRRGS